jgi:hypothetical protein
MPKAYGDLANLSEDDRITIIGLAAESQLVAFFVDDEKGKPERYKRKLLARFPKVEVISTTKGPVENVVTIKVGPRKGSLT